MSLSDSIDNSIARCREQVKSLLSEYVVPSKSLETISAKGLLERTEAKVVGMMSDVKEIFDLVSLIRPDATPLLLRDMMSIENKLSSYIEVLKQDTINPTENTRIGLEQLRQTIAEISEFVSRAEESSKSPDHTMSLVLDVVERSKSSGKIDALGGELKRVISERDYLKKRVEDVDYVLSSLRSEKATLEDALSQVVAQLQMAEEESKKWKQEALQNSLRGVEELLSQLKAQVESLRSENERLKIMVRLERARYFNLNQQSKEKTGT